MAEIPFSSNERRVDGEYAREGISLPANAVEVDVFLTSSEWLTKPGIAVSVFFESSIDGLNWQPLASMGGLVTPNLGKGGAMPGLKISLNHLPRPVEIRVRVTTSAALRLGFVGKIYTTE